MPVTGRMHLRRPSALGTAVATMLFAFASPAWAAAPIRPVYYNYDVLGRPTEARFDSATGADKVVSSYNGFGELTASTLTMGTFSKTLTSHYDGAGRRDQLIHPENSSAYTISYCYDARDQLTGIGQGTNCTTTPLDAFTWNDDGTLASRTEGTGTSAVTYSWDDIGRLTGQSDSFPTTSDNVSWAFTINPASQLASEARTESTNRYAYGGLVSVNRGYAVNGLNQYTTAGPASFAYDDNGNLTGDGTNSYTYDIENRLVSAVSGTTTVNLTYDPLGRLYQVDKGTTATTTRFLYDGDALVLEYNGNATPSVIQRYVHGSNTAADDPLVWYQGTLGTRRFLHADHLGSIVAASNGTAAASINSYDEYGIPASTNTGRFQYTGQAWLSELGMYYYKARIYSPTLGRFLRTDPIGYEGGINVYEYVDDDPVNKFDADGQRVHWIFEPGTAPLGKSAQSYLMQSPSYARNFEQLRNSTRTYTIRVGVDRDGDYNPKTRTIDFDPTRGLRLRDGSVQSAAVGVLGHEVDHAAEHDEIGTKAFEDALRVHLTPSGDNSGIVITVGTSREEQRATRSNDEVARQLGEPTRGTYHNSAGFPSMPTPETHMCTGSRLPTSGPC